MRRGLGWGRAWSGLAEPWRLQPRPPSLELDWLQQRTLRTSGRAGGPLQGGPRSGGGDWRCPKAKWFSGGVPGVGRTPQHSRDQGTGREMPGFQPPRPARRDKGTADPGPSKPRLGWLWALRRGLPSRRRHPAPLLPSPGPLYFQCTPALPGTRGAPAEHLLGCRGASAARAREALLREGGQPVAAADLGTPAPCQPPLCGPLLRPRVPGSPGARLACQSFFLLLLLAPALAWSSGKGGALTAPWPQQRPGLAQAAAQEDSSCRS